jgi:glycosyltransferase involved in cell wall biosynthesis
VNAATAPETLASLAAAETAFAPARDLRLAVVHDALIDAGGAERVLAAIHRTYPAAPVFVPVFRPQRLPEALRAMDVRTSSLQRIRSLREDESRYLQRCPRAMAGLDLAGFDVVLTSSRAFARSVRIPPGALHVCYCHAPMPRAWDPEAYFGDHGIRGLRRLLRSSGTGRLRARDAETAAATHYFLAPSTTVAQRIADAYRRDARVISPPVDAARCFVSPAPDDYFLVVSRLSERRNVHLAIDAVNRTPHRLVIAGAGPAEAGLRRLAGNRVSFLGPVGDDELPLLMSRCRALICPAETGSGAAPLVAMASGRPVVALATGVALDTVVDGETGVLFGAPTPDSLFLALQRLAASRFEPAAIRAHALQFDVRVFGERLHAFLTDRLEAFRADPLGAGRR